MTLKYKVQETDEGTQWYLPVRKSGFSERSHELEEHLFPNAKAEMRKIWQEKHRENRCAAIAALGDVDLIDDDYDVSSNEKHYRFYGYNKADLDDRNTVIDLLKALLKDEDLHGVKKVLDRYSQNIDL